MLPTSVADFELWHMFILCLLYHFKCLYCNCYQKLKTTCKFLVIRLILFYFQIESSPLAQSLLNALCVSIEKAVGVLSQNTIICLIVSRNVFYKIKSEMTKTNFDLWFFVEINKEL